jgi:hypothetical protein
MKLTVNMNRTKYLSAVLIAIAGLGLLQAKADTFSSELTVGNDAISPFPGPYANVLVTLTSPTTATVKFTSLTNSGKIYLMGGAQGTDLNINGTATASGFTFSQAGQTGFSTPSETGQGSGTVDGFGGFNLTIDYFNGFKHAFNDVQFTLTATGTTTWASAASVLTPNSSGFDAAAHIFVTSSPAVESNGAIATGFAAEVPEPATAFFLPAGILVFYLRFRSKK